MEITVEIEGIKDLEKNVRKLIKATDPDAVAQVLLPQAAMLEGRFRAAAPLGPTGRLKASAYSNLAPQKTAAFAGIRQGKSKAPHAHLVEFGHGGPHPAPAHPFMRPVWDTSKREVLEGIKEGIKEKIEGAI
jgi:HK97 gp10 family phage protein